MFTQEEQESPGCVEKLGSAMKRCLAQNNVVDVVPLSVVKPLHGDFDGYSVSCVVPVRSAKLVFQHNLPLLALRRAGLRPTERWMEQMNERPELGSG